MVGTESAQFDSPRAETNETGSVIDRAVAELQGNAVVTPIRRLHWLERFVDVPVYAKLEAQQKTGAFKYRGAFLAVARSPDRPIIAASAGNHGLAVAQACQELGRQVNICVPTTASRIKREHILATGAGLIEFGYSLEGASAHARELAAKRDLYYISPYDNPDVIAGSLTIGHEIAEQVPVVRSAVVPIGGGGLISGLAIALKERSSATKIFGCEPARYASMTESLARGTASRVVHQPTLADGLAVNLEANARTVAIVREHVANITLLTEEELAAGTLAMLVHESLLVEPAGAAAVVACLRLGQRGLLDGPVCLPLCGGNLSHASLTHIQGFAYEDPDLLRLLDQRGRPTTHTVTSVQQPTQAPQDRSDEPSGQPFATDLVQQLAACEAAIQSAEDDLHEYERYANLQGLVVPADGIQSLRSLATGATASLRTCRLALTDADASSTSTEDSLATAENLLRLGLSTVSYMRSALEWCSPSYSQSGQAQFFSLASQDAPVVNYDRYQHHALPNLESQMLDVLAGRPDRLGISITSSGMAAYSLIEAFLLRHVLQPGSSILLAPYIYFEAVEQIESLDFLDVTRSRDYSVEAFVEAYDRSVPAVIFADPIANTAEQSVVDVVALIGALRTKAKHPVTVVIDGTMTSAALPANVFDEHPYVQVLYYESCSKYLQLGMDASMAGLVLYPVRHQAEFERLRRNTGTILYRDAIYRYPRFDRQHFMARMSRMSENACLIADTMQQNDLVRERVAVAYPGSSHHPDHAATAQLAHCGGCVTFSYNDAGRTSRDQLEPVVDRMVAAANATGLHLTKGVSFGFSVPRISAASSMAESEPPFLRLFVGDRTRSQALRLAAIAAEEIIR